MASSDDILAPLNEATFNALLERHQSPHSDSIIPPLEEIVQDQTFDMIVMEDKTIQVILSFPRYCAGGPDGL